MALKELLDSGPVLPGWSAGPSPGPGGELLDSGPVLPGWSAGPSPGPGGADSETTAGAASGVGEGSAALAAVSREPGDRGGTARTRLDAPTHHGHLQSPLTWRTGSDPPAVRRDGIEVERGP